MKNNLTTEVAFVDLASQQSEIDEELWPALRDVFSRTAFIGGTEVREFEDAFAAYCGSRHCIGVGNGTDAIELALRATGVGAGAEVILPANTFFATAEAVLRAGASPVLVDVNPNTLLIDPEHVREKVSSRTAAVIGVHLYGQASAVEELERVLDGTGAFVLEDGAQSQGATRFGRRSGSLGRVGATSFYPGKNLGAAGDGGAVTTDDPSLERKIRMLGAHGSEQKYDHEFFGTNSRLDTVQAVVLKLKLARLDKWNRMRGEAADRYATLLHGIPNLSLPTTALGNVHAWHLYVVQVPHRDLVVQRLLERGINTGIHYPVPLHRSGAWLAAGLQSGSYPVTESASTSLLSLPMYPHISPSVQERIAEVISEIMTELQ